MDKRPLKNLIQHLEKERDELDKMINFLQTRFKSGEYSESPALAKVNLSGKKKLGRPAKVATPVKTKTKGGGRELSAEARKKMSEAAKKRHAQRRRENQSGN